MRIIITDSHNHIESHSGYMFYPAPVAPFLILAASVDEAKKLWEDYKLNEWLKLIPDNDLNRFVNGTINDAIDFRDMLKTEQEHRKEIRNG